LQTERISRDERGRRTLRISRMMRGLYRQYDSDGPIVSRRRVVPCCNGRQTEEGKQ